MLLYQPRFRHPEHAANPPNLAEAESNELGLTPVYADTTDLAVDIQTPCGEVLAIDDLALITRLAERLDGTHPLSLLRSHRSFTDCRPVSIFSMQTMRQIGEEVGFALDKRRFRANIYADLAPMDGFAENAFVGSKLQIGTKAVVAITDRDPRCKMITLDPNTAEARPEYSASAVRTTPWRTRRSRDQGRRALHRTHEAGRAGRGAESGHPAQWHAAAGAYHRASERC
jgi:hypothetical protein